MLISKLEKNKSMKAEERTEIIKTLKALDEKISQVKDELKTVAAPSKVKSKTEVRLLVLKGLDTSSQKGLLWRDNA